MNEKAEPKNASAQSERLIAKWKRCKDPYWRGWLESAIRFALWAETGRATTWPPSEPLESLVIDGT